MKKFLSMVMAAAMVVSLVPATAFAASGVEVKATAKVIGAQNYATGTLDSDKDVTGAELDLYVTTASYTTGANEDTKITVTLDNAYFTEDPADNGSIYYIDDVDGEVALPVTTDFDKVAEDGKADEIEITIPGNARFAKGDSIRIKLDTEMDKVSKGKTATVSVDSDDYTITNGDDLVYASIEDKGFTVSVKDTVDVAEEEVATLKDVKVKLSVGDDFAQVFDDKDTLKFKLNSGFEFVKVGETEISGGNYNGTLDSAFNNGDWEDVYEVEDDEFTIPLGGFGSTISADTITLSGLQVEATSAKAGSTATIKVYLTGADTQTVEVAKVVDYTVSMTVDEDDDVPVIYSGVNVENDGIVDDSDHEGLEVTLKETFPGAWNNSKDFTLSVPEGVYITNAKVSGFAGDDGKDTNGEAWFEAAYEEGDYVDLTFKRRTWDETEPGDDEIEINFTLTLVADPNFEGDVVLKLTGDAMDEQEVTIAKFVKPYTVEAQQNDMQIDYRNTEIPTSVVIKEAEAGLWDKGAKFVLSLDKINFDDEGTIAVDDKSGLEVKDDEVKTTSVDGNDAVYFVVDSRSDDEPAVVTISGMQLYMDRSLPAGAYDLELNVVGMNDLYEGQVVLNGDKDQVEKVVDGKTTKVDRTISDINDDFVSYTAKAGFVNIVTAGREDTDSFTTKVVVPVGENYLISGENKVEIDVPAYINANGYTMLPLRAVAVALGINENNVLWDQASRTATVMYGSKIINMTYGQKVVYVNGAMIPATAAVEITNDRMFLGLRDLGNALGVTDITWDAATKTATLNGNK